MRKLLVALVFAGAAALPGRVEAQGYPEPPPAVRQALLSAGARYGVSYYRLRCLAWHESRYRAGVKSPLVGAPGDGRYHGLFQFDWPTWRDGSIRAGYGGAGVYDPWAASHVTAYLISHGEGSRWPPLRWC